MKSLGYLMTIASTAIGLAMPMSARAQSAIRTPGIERVPLGGFHSTTTYTPSPDNVTTTVKTQIGDGDVAFPPATYNYYGSTERYRNELPSQQPLAKPAPSAIVIYQQPSTFPRATLTRCVLKTLDDPARSIVAVDRYTGKPCD
jgi:hypothetical protein